MNTGTPRPLFRSRWTTEEDEELRRRIEQRQTAGIITAAMGRTNHAIRGRAGELGLMVPTTIAPWRVGVKR